MVEPTSTCLCGGRQSREYDSGYYDVTEAGETRKAKDTMRVAECLECGVHRRAGVLWKEGDYESFYSKYPPTNASYRAKDYEHDRRIAAMRCDDYQLIHGCRDKILDVGSGSGAFVDECRSRGGDAVGCEIADYFYGERCGAFIYHQRFEDVHFPTDHFDKVTCHDVIEHVPDPVAFAKEIYRVTKQGGACFIECPRFFHESGKHHWKLEHLWYFNEKQMLRLLREVGFTFVEVRHPIESKVVFQVVKPHEERVKILLPPGIGDSYWSIVKLQAFLRREKISKVPDMYVACPREKNYGGHLRSFPFIEMFPFMRSTWISVWTGRKSSIWEEAYAQQGRTIFRNVNECDFFIAYNGHLRVGEALEDVDPDLACEWFPPMFTSLEQDHFRMHATAAYGRYLVLYFVFQGTYKYWLKEFHLNAIARSINAIVDKTGCTPVFVGAMWDRDDDKLTELKQQIPEHVDLIGKTNLQQLFGLIRGAQAVVGWPSGLTIMASVLKQKTVIVWNDYYDNNFAWYACPPEVRGTTYLAENTKSTNAEKLSDTVSTLISWEPGDSPIAKPQTVKVQPKSIKPKPTVAVVCVLKSGGDFTPDYVSKLQNMARRNSITPHEFICLTDMPIKDCVTEPLVGSWSGWWSKLEIFRPGITNADKILYMDLDVVITRNIDRLLEYNCDFAALTPWNRNNRLSGMCASGMMMWANGEYSFLYDDAAKLNPVHYPRGDQQFIYETLKAHGKKWDSLQSVMPGIYSYKRECRESLPKDATIILFHGNPRPHEASKAWIKEHWK